MAASSLEITIPGPDPPVTRERRVLAIDVHGELFDSYAPLLRRRALEVERFPHPRSSLALVSAVPFELILIGYPLRDMEFGRFIQALRRSDSASKNAALLLLAHPIHRASAESHAARGGGQVQLTDDPPTVIEQAVGRLLRVAPRKAARLATRLEVRLNSGAQCGIGETTNVSATGMLVATSEPWPKGTQVGFEFMLGHRPVVGVARVVRHALPERERTLGVGVEFVSFQGDSRQRFLRYVARL